MLTLKGICLNKLNRSNESLECFDLAIKLNMNCSDAYVSKGECLLEQKEYSAAIDAFNAAIYLDPTNKRYQELKNIALDNKGILLTIFEQILFKIELKWF